MIFKRTIGRTVGSENLKGGITERKDLKDWEGFRGGILKFARKMKILGGGGSRKSSIDVRGDHFIEVTFKGRIG